MLCDKCKKNPASVIIHQNINGHVAQYNLCEECAAATASNMTFENMIKTFMNSVMGISPSSDTQEQESDSSHAAIACARCGLTYEGFKSSGKLGCSDCYNAFRNQLINLFKNVHGSAVHTGKLPLRGGAQLTKVREVERLRDRLKKLVGDEEFEEAAKVRDKIKELT